MDEPNDKCKCGHARREHNHKICLMAGCFGCKGFVKQEDEIEEPTV